ncbi:hypothetical protein BGX21_007310 [Mortierella sp. AD011]|nr:hypothetical protein BGX20_003507 [Mortierella sp. AD010]KAF9398770.1 hypothetical protein BGX21_007310 [Mortierella sp. AD011]
MQCDKCKGFNELEELLFEIVILSLSGFIGPTWDALEALLLLKKKSRPEERDEEDEAEEALHFMFLKKAIEEGLVSIF